MRWRTLFAALILTTGCSGATGCTGDSDGDSVCRVKDVVGKAESVAVAELTAARCTVDVTESNESPFDRTVIRQDVAPGSYDVPKTVTLTLAVGPRPTAVPDLQGLSEAVATATVRGVGLVERIETVDEPWGSANVGRVVSQDPSAPTHVPPGSTVLLRVGRVLDPVHTVQLRGSVGIVDDEYTVDEWKTFDLGGPNGGPLTDR